MKQSVAFALTLGAAGAILGVATRAQAQFCSSLDSTSFLKTVRDLNGGNYEPGDIVLRA